jgi:cytochrome P450
MATAARKYDLYSDAFRADTYATFARMREQDPVLCQPGLDGETSIWFVTRYDDAEAVLRDNVRFVRDPRLALPPEQLRSGLPEFVAFIDSNMLNRDGEDHRRLRRLVSKAFTPRMIERLRPRIQEIADELIHRVSAAGEMELVSAFAFPLPMTVIAELLGVPPSPTATGSGSGRPRWSGRR